MRGPTDPIDCHPRAVKSYLHPSRYSWRMHIWSVCAVSKCESSAKKSNDPADLTVGLFLHLCLAVLWESNEVWQKGPTDRKLPEPCRSESKKICHFSARFTHMESCWDAELRDLRGVSEVIPQYLSVSSSFFLFLFFLHALAFLKTLLMTYTCTWRHWVQRQTINNRDKFSLRNQIIFPSIIWKYSIDFRPDTEDELCPQWLTVTSSGTKWYGIMLGWWMLVLHNAMQMEQTHC